MPNQIVVSSSDGHQTYDLVDIVGIANNQKARQLTNKFFQEIDSKIIYKNIRRKDVWIFNDIFFSGIALPFTQLEAFLSKLNKVEKISISGQENIYTELLAAWCLSNQVACDDRIASRRWTEYFLSCCFDVFLVLASFVSVCVGAFIRPKVVLWTGDFSAGGSVRDPRWGKFYEELEKRQVSYCEMIRTTVQSPREIIKNITKRKFGFFYYQSLWNIFSLIFIGQKFQMKNGQQKDLFIMVFDKYYSAIRTLAYIETVISFVFSILRPQIAYSFCINSRSAPFVWGAQKFGVKSIGIMHGMSSRSYMGYEYMEPYTGESIGNDSYGVWSEYWYDQFRQHSKLFSQSKLEVSGPQKNMPRPSRIELKNQRVKNVLVISEQELDVQEFLPYYQELQSNGFSLTLKVRPFGKDKFLEKLKTSYPDIKIPVSSDHLEAVVENFDVVVGSHSTAVLEASQCGRPFLLFKSQKWEDVFNLKKYTSDIRVYNENPSDLVDSLKSLHEHKQLSEIYIQLRDSFFGNKSGVDWLLKLANKDI